MKKVINRGKRSKTLSEVKAIKNIIKNLQSFLDVSPVQKEVPIYHINYNTMHMSTRILLD